MTKNRGLKLFTLSFSSLLNICLITEAFNNFGTNAVFIVLFIYFVINGVRVEALFFTSLGLIPSIPGLFFLI